MNDAIKQANKQATEDPVCLKAFSHYTVPGPGAVMGTGLGTLGNNWF